MQVVQIFAVAAGGNLVDNQSTISSFSHFHAIDTISGNFGQPTLISALLELSLCMSHVLKFNKTGPYSYYTYKPHESMTYVNLFLQVNEDSTSSYGKHSQTALTVYQSQL